MYLFLVRTVIGDDAAKLLLAKYREHRVRRNTNGIPKAGTYKPQPKRKAEPILITRQRQESGCSDPAPRGEAGGVRTRWAEAPQPRPGHCPHTGPPLSRVTIRGILAVQGEGESDPPPGTEGRPYLWPTGQSSDPPTSEEPTVNKPANQVKVGDVLVNLGTVLEIDPYGPPDTVVLVTKDNFKNSGRFYLPTDAEVVVQ